MAWVDSLNQMILVASSNLTDSILSMMTKRRSSLVNYWYLRDVLESRILLMVTLVQVTRSTTACLNSTPGFALLPGFPQQPLP